MAANNDTPAIEMNYLEFSFRVTPEDPGLEIAEAALSQLAFESFTIEDGVLKAYVREDLFDKEGFDGMFLWSLDGFDISYETVVVEQQNWNALWESNFQTIDVEGKAMVRAPFHKAPESGLDIIIEPRMSFGTGHHQTTYMMMSLLLDTDCAGKNVCDMGCGTGVLAIIAAKQGARDVLAVDIDQWAYENSLDNIKANGCSGIRVKQGGAEVLGNENFDIFIANINRNILLRYMADYAAAVRPGGILMLSGFYVPDAGVLIAEAAKYGFELHKSLEKDHWSALMLTKS